MSLYMWRNKRMTSCWLRLTLMKLALQVSYKGRCNNLKIAHPNGHVWYRVKVNSGEGAGIDELHHPSPLLPFEHCLPLYNRFLSLVSLSLLQNQIFSQKILSTCSLRLLCRPILMWISILLRFSLFNFPQGSENTTNWKRTIHFIEVFCTVLKSIKTVKSSNDGNTWKSNKPLTRARNETLRSGRCCWFNVKSGKRATCKRLNVAKWKWKTATKQSS